MSKELEVLKNLIDLACWEDRIPVIGICGAGASGKSKLARGLSNVSIFETVTLGTDAWFSQPTIVHRDFIAAARLTKNPELIAHHENPFNRHDWNKFASDFETLMTTGRLQTNGLYDRKYPDTLGHSLDIKLPIYSPSLVVMEGLYLMDGMARKHINYLIALDIPSDVILERRMKREIGTKTEEQIRERHALEEKYVRPYHESLFHTADVKLGLAEMDELHGHLKDFAEVAARPPIFEPIFQNAPRR